MLKPIRETMMWKTMMRMNMKLQAAKDPQIELLLIIK
jgi:hypothetical protein